METLSFIILGLMVLGNAYSFFCPEKEQERIYQETARDTNFNRYRGYGG